MMLTQFVVVNFVPHVSGRNGCRSFSRAARTKGLLSKLNLGDRNSGVFAGKWFDLGERQLNRQVCPSTGAELAQVSFGTVEDYRKVIRAMDAAKRSWSSVPAPERGEVVRKIGEKLRLHKHDLGMMITLEMGKILTEGLGEVQEAIDICDYAVGLSRCINGSVIPSERPDHIMMERYNPLKGHVGIISAFNFPVAVYFWNLALSMVCGNTNLWKPAESTSLVSVAVTKLVAEVLAECGQPGAIASMICGHGAVIGDALVRDPRMELVSFTGSTRAGRTASQHIAARFGKSILELGGNNAMIVDKSADVGMAVRATLFGAAGTAGQRCTTQRRTYLHADIYDEFVSKLVSAYGSIRIGDPLNGSVLCGPLHNAAAVETYKKALVQARQQGGTVLCGGEVLNEKSGSVAAYEMWTKEEALELTRGNFVMPTVVEIAPTADIIQEEKFVPILYVMKVHSYEEAVAYNNGVAQGLSSSLFTRDMQQIFHWTGPSATGSSDCGIVNVNIGTSGAEIGGAFGGEKETGAGGRESGSDAWKQYMRRSTCTINYSDKLPLAQGVNFE